VSKNPEIHATINYQNSAKTFIFVDKINFLQLSRLFVSPHKIIRTDLPKEASAKSHRALSCPISFNYAGIIEFLIGQIKLDGALPGVFRLRGLL
jgi:hypothetical protein